MYSSWASLQRIHRWLRLRCCTRAGASIAQRDRRGRSVTAYAPEGSDVRRLLQGRLEKMEAVAVQLQQALLASLDEDGDEAKASSAASKAGAAGSGKVGPGRHVCFVLCALLVVVVSGASPIRGGWGGAAAHACACAWAALLRVWGRAPNYPCVLPQAKRARRPHSVAKRRMGV